MQICVLIVRCQMIHYASLKAESSHRGEVRLTPLHSTCTRSAVSFLVLLFGSVADRILTYWVGTVSSPDGKEFSDADEKAITQVMSRATAVLEYV